MALNFPYIPPTPLAHRLSDGTGAIGGKRRWTIERIEMGAARQAKRPKRSQAKRDEKANADQFSFSGSYPIDSRAIPC